MNVAIVGGGASGLVAAIMALKNGHKVTIFEHKDKLGKKILATGNGRCNLSNRSLFNSPETQYFYDKKNKDFVSEVFSKFGISKTIELFEDLGLMIKDRNGLLYPYSDQASAVLDSLRFRVDALGGLIETDCEVLEINIETGKFLLKTNKGKKTADYCIVATGSKAQPKLGTDGSGYDMVKKLGHSINKVSPGLVQLCSSEKYFKQIAGVRVQSKVTLIEGNNEYTQMGELQITQYGISGIAVMNLSNRITDPSKCEVVVDLVENLTNEQLKRVLKDKCRNNEMYPVSELLCGILPKKLGDLIISLSGIDRNRRCGKMADKDIDNVVKLVKNWHIKISGTNSFEEAQICRGGIPLEEMTVDFESRLVKGLYIVGEILDIHGDCGGYNLQWAWTSGAVAGMSIPR